MGGHLQHLFMAHLHIIITQLSNLSFSHCRWLLIVSLNNTPVRPPWTPLHFSFKGIYRPDRNRYRKPGRVSRQRVATQKNEHYLTSILHSLLRVWKWIQYKTSRVDVDGQRQITDSSNINSMKIYRFLWGVLLAFSKV